MRPAPLALLTVLLGCGHPPRPIPLSPLGLTHVREHYRVAASGSAIVLPFLDCTAEEPDLAPNREARRHAATTVTRAVWKELALPGSPDDVRLAEHEGLCKELADNHDSGTNIDDASPVMRERLRDFFRRHPDKVWLVVFTRYLRLGGRVAGPGPGVGALAGQVVETDTLELSAYVFTVRGDVAFRADMVCDQEGSPGVPSCGRGYAESPRRIVSLLDGFPRSILSQAVVYRTTPLNREAPTAESQALAETAEPAPPSDPSDFPAIVEPRPERYQVDSPPARTAHRHRKAHRGKTRTAAAMAR
jgi:hypothetical protein